MIKVRRAFFVILIFIILGQTCVIYWQYKVHSEYQSQRHAQLFSTISLTLLDIAAYKKTGNVQALARLEAETFALSREADLLNQDIKDPSLIPASGYHPPNAAIGRFLLSGGPESEMKQYLTKLEGILQGYLDSRISYKENKDNASDFLDVWREVVRYTTSS
ncbi:hypothetical protein CBW65_02685 [Tumebacillus avium]|uniref:Uncharacterized protein n=1 Tax=Tumebacillus avium TaxID=1903704 RepID=A0A1Y0IHU8_9BACL|nr:hypothetical protein [Tumebacillus avium]ARU60081.1 hypothetical protein CBW65_02685 [Tumebacillus avium]